MPSSHQSLLSPGDHLLELNHHGRLRTALVHVPPAALGPARLPLVLAMHGGGTNARTMADFCGLSEKADADGFFVVYPNGTGRQDELYTWNAGNCCGYALRFGVDDVAFIDRLLDRLDNELPIDRRRIFATGMSNGAMLAYRLADELSERIAAIAPVAGPMGSADCHPRRPVSVIHFHGTGDEFAPYNGGKGLKSLSKAVFYSVEHSVAAWIAANGCPSQTIVETLTSAADSEMPVTRRVYGPGREGSEVVLITIEGGGHTWPGRLSTFHFLGPSSLAISANDLMWDFFERHPL